MYSQNRFITDLQNKGITRLLFCGDIHGEFSTFFSNIKNNIGKNALIIVCGDVSFGFHKPQYYIDTFNKYKKTLEELNSYVAFVRGNHDDPTYFNDLNSICPKLANDFNNIWIMQDYQVILTELGNILCFGGARSVDKNWRVKGVSYWEKEMPINMPDGFKDYINEHNLEIDYVATHSSPSFCEPKTKHGLEQFYIWDKEVYEDCDVERSIITNSYNYLVDNSFHIKKWFYGHFHKHYSAQFNTRNEIETRFIGLDRCRIRYDSREDSNRNNKIACDFYEIKEAGYEETFG